MSFKKLTPKELRAERPTQSQLAQKERKPIWAIFEDIRSQYNVGAMFRTSDAALVGKIFLIGTTPIPPNPRIDKSALGAVDVVPWQHYKQVGACLKDIRSQGVSI